MADEVEQAKVESKIFSEKWKDAADGEIPAEAFVGGKDHDCDLFVGRAVHNDELLPGKVKSNNKICYISWGGEEHGKEEYQVLCGTGFEWVSCSGSDIPEGAVPGGTTENREVLYVGRVPHEDTVTVGKVHPSHGSCYIAYEGTELGFPEYEILVSKSV